MIKAWTEEAWEDFEYWTTQDRRMLKRILQLLKDIDRNGYEGIGKPERLSGDLASYGQDRPVRLPLQGQITPPAAPTPGLLFVAAGSVVVVALDSAVVITVILRIINADVSLG